MSCLLSGNTYAKSPEDFKLRYYVIINCLMKMWFGSLCLDWSGSTRLCCSDEETLTAPCLCVFSQAKSNTPEVSRLSCGAAHGTRGPRGSSQCLSPGVTHGTSPQGPLVERAHSPASGQESWVQWFSQEEENGRLGQHAASFLPRGCTPFFPG